MLSILYTKTLKQRLGKDMLHTNQPNAKSKLCGSYSRAGMDLLWESVEIACLVLRNMEIEYKHREKTDGGTCRCSLLRSYGECIKRYTVIIKASL